MRRGAARLDVGRRGAKHSRHIDETARNQARRRKLGDAQRHVVTFLDCIDLLVAQHEL
jgi:hypothetical protein